MAFLKGKEFYELMDQFERDYKEHGHTRLDREKDKEYWGRGIFYQHGETNLAFVWYMNGYQMGKNAHQPETALAGTCLPHLWRTDSRSPNIMSKPSKKLIKKLLDHGIKPGVMVMCAHGGTKAVVQPVAHWYMFSEHLHQDGEVAICLWGPAYKSRGSKEIFATPTP